MKRRYQFAMLLALAMPAVVAAQGFQPTEQPTRSVRSAGPDGLEGWTLDSPVRGSGYGDERFAFMLVIARHGHIIRRISGEPVIWKWIFWADGRQVAYETGAFHFTETCFLIRLSDGRKLDSYDCFHDLPLIKPDWVKALDAME
jgi:hypothetical protein